MRGGDILTGAYDPRVDIKAQRIIDLSQDELLVSFSLTEASGSDDFVCSAHLRLLLKYG